MRPIYTLDLETDPFLYGRKPEPFVSGLYDGERFFSFWGNDCTDAMLKLLYELPPGIVYAHNGGRFDFLYGFIDAFATHKSLVIINGRIVKAHIECKSGLNDDSVYHELRDSMAIMPFALAKYDKDIIDYKKFERKVREKHRPEIVKYLRKDCVSLHELCTAFRDRFGDNLTIGGTAMKRIKELHPFEELTEQEDSEIRHRFYYGGRVQCFEKGMLIPNGNEFNVFDLNQCYPYSMRDFMHPIGHPSFYGKNISKQTCFVTCYGKSYGAFPKRTDNGLQFVTETGNFQTTIHEYNAAVETGMFECQDILETIDFEQLGNMATFVDEAHGLRKNAQLTGDKIGSLQYKYFGNSGYGKYAQNPEDYYDYVITEQGDALSDPWEPCDLLAENIGYIIWRKPAVNTRRYNVATGASITGAARSLLIRALAKAKRPVYCDTDSIICESLKGVTIDATQIGAWKKEQSGSRIAISGKKVYALFADKMAEKEDRITCKNHRCGHCKYCVKMASKGVHLFPHQVIDAAQGKEIEWFNDAPTFNWKTRETRFIHRRVRMT